MVIVCKRLRKGVKTDADIERYEGGSDTMAFWTPKYDDPLCEETDL